MWNVLFEDRFHLHFKIMASYFSNLLSEAMDCIGYSEKIIKVRAHTCKEIFEVASQSYLMEAILAGSKSEGVVPIHDSDIDIMYVSPFCICVDHGRLEDNIIIIETDMNDCPSGYTKLRSLGLCYCFGIHLMINSDNMDFTTAMPDIMMYRNSRYFPDNNPYINSYKQVNKTTSGPADLANGWQSKILGLICDGVSIDCVSAIRYYSTKLLQKWAKRNRQFDWPPHDVIEDVSTTEGYIVPFGNKLSTGQNLEWRICFTTGECKLVASFNATQLKLYVLLKMVVKDILTPAVDCVSSYMVKNVVFLVMEHTPTFVFTPSNLAKCVLHALCFLLHCLHNNNLPNYMIPNRNLLIGRVQGNQITELRHLARELLNEGETIVLKCEKLRNAIYVAGCNRSLATRIQSWRDETEQLYMLLILNSVKKYKSYYKLQGFSGVDGMIELMRNHLYWHVARRLAFVYVRNGANAYENVRALLHKLLS
ncbi:uncharacterized protein LOC132734803 [Ruditapes philippinarum]|uniref:uncharacterized protein LOC132734803 n=1 Tax=Ruditapes philippinarum TaxID=129788 RepID=UPI00295B2874|nr:uncharacterized protein LOC132734803 [Ruditapes philippinarum]